MYNTEMIGCFPGADIFPSQKSSMLFPLSVQSRFTQVRIGYNSSMFLSIAVDVLGNCIFELPTKFTFRTGGVNFLTLQGGSGFVFAQGGSMVGLTVTDIAGGSMTNSGGIWMAGASNSTTNAAALFGGAATCYPKLIVNALNQSMAAGAVSCSFLVARCTITTQGAAVSPIIAGSAFLKPTIALNTGLVTNAATVYIEDAPAGAATANFALWVDNGIVRIDDAIAAPAPAAGVGIANFYGANAANFLGDPNNWLRLNIAGVAYKIPCYL